MPREAPAGSDVRPRAEDAVSPRQAVNGGEARWGRGASVALTCNCSVSDTLISDFYRVMYERAQIQFECDIYERSSCVCQSTLCHHDRAGSGPPLLGVGHMRCDPRQGLCRCGLAEGTDHRPPAFGFGGECGFGRREWDRLVKSR